MTKARDVVEVLARALVGDDESVSVEVQERRVGESIALRAKQGDMGKLIGRQGRTANAIRSLASLAVSQEGHSVSIDFIDE